MNKLSSIKRGLTAADASSSNKYNHGAQNLNEVMSSKESTEKYEFTDQEHHQKFGDEREEEEEEYETELSRELELNQSRDGDGDGREDVEMQQRPPSSTLLLEQSGGRDSGISTDSSKFQDFFTKCSQVEDAIKERVTASQRELQEAKKKLEELRLLRFEEKNVLRQEIEELHDKVDTEESRTSKLEEKLKRSKTESVLHSQRICDLSKEQEIGSQINMMQEQEIVRLEMKLKEETLERITVSQQLDQHRRSVIDHDKVRLKLQGELYMTKEHCTQLEEANAYYKSEWDTNYRRLRDSDQAVIELQAELKIIQKSNDSSLEELNGAMITIKVLEGEKAKLADATKEQRSIIEDLKSKMESETERFISTEKGFKTREECLQQDLENSSINEAKLIERCDELETLYHDTRREKDEQHFELKQIVDRAAALEQRVNEVEDEKTDLEFDLSEIRNSLARCMKQPLLCDNTDCTVTGSVDCIIAEANSNNNNTNTVISPNHLETFFEENNAKMLRFQHDIEDMSIQLVKERAIVGDLNGTIDELKEELEKAQGNILTISTLKDALESQQQRTNETLRIQEKDFQRKLQQNEDLRDVINDYEARLAMQENVISSMSDETQQLTTAHKEERKKLKTKLLEMEAQKQLTESSKRKNESLIESDKNRLEDEIENKTKENEELKQELEKLIDDNKNLARRLLHLESYSDRLSDLLEHQQTDNQKLKDKTQKEFRQYRDESGEKEVEIATLKSQLDELNRSLTEKQDQGDRLGTKLKYAKDNNKDTERKLGDAEKYNDELKRRLDLVNEAHSTAERKAKSEEDENVLLKKRIEDQKKGMEELFIKIRHLEQEASTLKEGLHASEKRLHLKEDLILELTKKTGQAADNFNSLRHTLEQAEYDGQQYEKKFLELRKNQLDLQKMLTESETGRSHLKDQIANLQRLLVKSEDEKDLSVTECSRYQRQLEKERAVNKRLQESNEKRKELEDLHEQVANLRSELHHEKKLRERLEELYYKRDEQVSQLRSTFDQSLNTLSKDTRNIKSILGKSLKKLDRDMVGNGVDVTEDEATSSSEKTFNGGYQYTFPRPSSPGGRYPRNHFMKSLPTSQSQQHRSKSAVEIPVEEIRFKYSTPKVTPPSHHGSLSVSPYNNNNNNNNNTSINKRSPHFIASNVPTTHARSSYYHETPTRDIVNGNGGKMSSSSEHKRYSK